MLNQNYLRILPNILPLSSYPKSQNLHSILEGFSCKALLDLGTDHLAIILRRLDCFKSNI